MSGKRDMEDKKAGKREYMNVEKQEEQEKKPEVWRRNRRGPRGWVLGRSGVW